MYVMDMLMGIIIIIILILILIIRTYITEKICKKENFLPRTFCFDITILPMLLFKRPVTRLVPLS